MVQLKARAPLSLSGIVEMPTLLELFSGTGSVGRPFRRAGWDVISVDLDSRYNPEVVCDIMDWDYSQCPTPDVIWASPPCVLYSCARTRAQTCDLAQADALVARTLEIIRYFTGLNPDLKWFMENPDTGKMKGRPLVQELPFVVLDYCMYGAPYRKRTRIWTNTRFVPRPLCDMTCSAPKHGNAHWFAAQRGGLRHRDGALSKGFSLDELHALPPQLCDEIFAGCSIALFGQPPQDDLAGAPPNL